ncbi:LOW QUALITY PROTEIN: putative ATP-dependent RNA helicase TDRD12 [Chanos chanos]|uniref:RNA helicase n=1 Tax=Chanos chanos TaxID=29144 RepID=A0A6J2WVB4_CHACN|nr:LOW QUALITY PROTEIN: putative ATP-dependent RNA helicase TDRD12 [Chanos chanos]
MLEISVLKVEDPSCLWGRIVKGPCVQAHSPKDYEDLQVKMNLFYHDVNFDEQKLKLNSLEEGQVCVVFHSDQKNWCRAVVESLLLGTVNGQAVCFLVDHAERIVVHKDEVRVALDQFLELPFWMQKFELAGIQPMRLQVSLCEQKAELVPSCHWDSSATRYLLNLIQASTRVQAVLCGRYMGSSAIQLYLTIQNVKICVNDDLVVKKFACLSSAKTNVTSQNSSVDPSPVSLTCDIFSSPDKFLATNVFHAATSLPPAFLFEEGHRDDIIMGESTTSGAGDSGGSSVKLNGESYLKERQNVKEELACARLLQLLNPDPFNPDADSLDTNVSKPISSAVLVHSAITVDPCVTLSHAPITENFRKFLLRRKYAGPGEAESYCWPSVARGCDTVLVSHSGEDPVSYLPPLLAHIQLSSVYSPLSAHSGPLSVILCPGWEKVQMVMELLEESQAAQCLHPAAALIGLGKDEATNFKIQKNCQLLVTTPSSMARLLAAHCFLFLRLCHLVLHEADVLCSRTPAQMETILQHFKKLVCSEERVSCPRQIISVAKRWTPPLDSLVREHMFSPNVIITALEEAALYGQVHQVVLLCLDSSKTSVLLSSLDFNPSLPQKTLIIANSPEEVEHVHKVVTSTSAFSLKAHEGLTFELDFVIQLWNQDIGPDTQVILVTTNECLKALGIRDATCVVHYGFPSSPKLFGLRLLCMSENFRNLSDKSTGPGVQSVLLLSERSARHIPGVLRYLKRTNASLPPELLQFARGVQRAKEEQKTDRPLCGYLKSTGCCRDSSACADRHSVSRILDNPQHSFSGIILVLPLYIKSASVYYGRVVRQKDDCYETLSAQMSSHYAREKLCAKDVLEGELYGIQERDVYHRVRVTEVPDKGDRLFSSVTAHFLDEGRTQEVKSHQLFQLPTQFHQLPPQAVEIIVCRVQPIDGEVHWNPKVTRAISQKIQGKLHQAKVVLSLGNTIWVDPMVRVTRLPGLKTFINEYNISDEILATGMGTTNPQHVDLLKELIQHQADSSTAQTSHAHLFESSPVTLKLKVQAEEEPLSSKVNASEENLSTGPELRVEPPKTGLNDPQRFESSPVTLKLKVQAEEEPLSSKVNASEENLSTGPDFHPQVKWYEKKNTVIVHIKLTCPDKQRCEFYSDRVIYSAYVNERHYLANLELQGNVIPEHCSWSVEGNEPEIRLVKLEERNWKTLLKHKSPFVCYNFDYIGEEEMTMLNGPWFVADAKDEGCYVISDSELESDSD